MIRILAKIIIAIIAFFIADKYYQAVLPPAGALVIAWALALAELFSSLVVRGSQHGGGLVILVKAGLPLLVWPAFAWFFERMLGWDWCTSVAIASGLAGLCGVIGAGRGSGREGARLAAAGVSASLPLYALIVCLVAGAGSMTMGLAVGGVAVVPVVARMALTWPAKQERILLFGSGVCGAVSVFWFVAAMVS